MANSALPYSVQVREKYNAKTESLLNELPSYCTSFINYKYEITQPRTRCAYVQDLRIFFQFLKEKNPLLHDVAVRDIPLSLLDSLDQDDIQEFLRWLETYTVDGKSYCNGRTGKKRKLASLRTFYKYISSQKGMITNNPAIKVDLPKLEEKDGFRILEQSEREDLMELLHFAYDNAVAELAAKEPSSIRYQDRLKPAFVKRDIAIFYLFLGSGLRVSELVGLNIGDIKENNGRINIVRKGGSHDHIYVSDEVLDVLYDYIYGGYRNQIGFSKEEPDALFVSIKHTRLSVRSVERIITDYCDMALGENHGITPHRLRATFGTQYYAETGDIRATADVLGHRSTEVTRKHYARSQETSKEYMRTMKVSNFGI